MLKWGTGISKQLQKEITLERGFGVVGDVHGGELVRHRLTMARDATQPNLRQVHLIHAELIEALQEQGFSIEPGSVGENVTTRGVALLDLLRGAIQRVGESAVIEITGLRNPCSQLDELQEGLMAAVLGRDAAGRLVRVAGVMGIVRESGVIRAGDMIRVELPEGAHEALSPV